MRRLKVVVVVAFATVAVAFSGCKKEDPKTTYEIINNGAYHESTVPYLDNTMWEVIVFQYIGNDVAKQENIKSIKYGGGTSGKLEISDKIEKIKVSSKLLPIESSIYSSDANYRLYTVSYLFIEKGKNNVFEIDDKTMMSKYRD